MLCSFLKMKTRNRPVKWSLLSKNQIFAPLGPKHLLQPRSISKYTGPQSSGHASHHTLGEATPSIRSKMIDFTCVLLLGLSGQWDLQIRIHTTWRRQLSEAYMLRGGQAHASKGRGYVQEALLPSLAQSSEQRFRWCITLHSTTRSNTHNYLYVMGQELPRPSGKKITGGS